MGVVAGRHDDSTNIFIPFSVNCVLGILNDKSLEILPWGEDETKLKRTQVPINRMSDFIVSQWITEDFDATSNSHL